MHELFLKNQTLLQKVESYFVSIWSSGFQGNFASHSGGGAVVWVSSVERDQVASRQRASYSSPNQKSGLGAIELHRSYSGQEKMATSVCWSVCTVLVKRTHGKMSNHFCVFLTGLEWEMYGALMIVLNCFMFFSFLGLTSRRTIFCILGLVGFFCLCFCCWCLVVVFCGVFLEGCGLQQGRGQWIVAGNGRQLEMDLAIQTHICLSPLGKQV